MSARRPARKLSTDQEGECLDALSLCVISLNSFWTAVKDFEKIIGFKVANLEHLIREDWRTAAPTADLRPLLQRIIATQEEKQPCQMLK